MVERSDGEVAAIDAAFATLGRRLATGDSIAEVALEVVRTLLGQDHGLEARALALGLGQQGLVEVSNLCLGLCSHARGWHGLAVDHWTAVGDDLLRQHVLVELCESVLRDGRADQRARLLGMLTHRPLQPDTAVEVAARLLVAGEDESAQALYRTVDPGAVDPDSDLASTYALLRESWDDAPPHVPVGAIAVGVLDYQMPDMARASVNLGDHVQTLAMLGHLARFSDVTFTGEGELGDLVAEIQHDVPDHLRLPGRAQAHLVGVHRDFSTWQNLPAPVWTIAFGWHMHTLFGLTRDFPYHPSVRPLFISFHLNQLDVLTPEAVAYLRRYGPVGCRDWASVYLLRSAGIEAFFSGCLTTTVDGTVPPGQRPRPPAPVAAVDALARVRRRMSTPFETYTHRDDSLRRRSVADGVRQARDRLVHYRSHHRRLVTSRLHAYLPAVSLGLTTRWVSRNPSDPRFAGLGDLEPGHPRLLSMQTTLRELLASVLARVLQGQDEQQVYAAWREATAPLVQQAARHHETVAASALPVPDVERLVAVIRAEADARGADYDSLDQPVVDVALSLDANLAEQLPVCIDAMLAGSSRPLRLWVMTRGLGVAYRQWLAEAFPETSLVFLPCDHVDYGDITRMFEHITTSTMDRLLLPEVLTDVSRLTYVDVDALVLGDIADLAATDLAGHALAARDTGKVGHLSAWRTAMTLPPDLADELRARVTQRNAVGLGGLNAGILVMDCDRLRADGFTATCLSWVQAYGMNDQDVLIAYAGARRASLDPRWNSWPLMENSPDARIVHYLGPGKPWRPLLVPQGELWRDRAAALASRLPWPPPT